MRKINIFIIPGPPTLSYPALRNIVEILMPITEDIYISLQEKSQINLSVFKRNGLDYDILRSIRFPIIKIVKHFFCNFILVMYFIKIRKKIDFLLLFQSESVALVLMAKLFRKKVVHFMGGSLSRNVEKMLELPNFNFLEKALWRIYVKTSNLEFKLSNKLVLITPKLLHDEIYKKYENKVVIAYVFPSLNFYDNFDMKRDIWQRPLLIGYIGGFSPVKGVLQLAEAIPKIISKLPNLKIMFIGDIDNKNPSNIGNNLKSKLIKYPNVIFVGRVSHDNLPKYLNEFRLLVLPSFSEGLPSVVLEAMACGTPVAATPVGAIPDVIVDGKTGYILESNSPDYLADAILKILNDKRINLIGKSAHNNVRSKFTHEKAVTMWRKIFEELQ